MPRVILVSIDVLTLTIKNYPYLINGSDVSCLYINLCFLQNKKNHIKKDFDMKWTNYNKFRSEVKNVQFKVNLGLKVLKGCMKF